MFGGIGDQLRAQELVYEQYRGADSQQAADQAQEAVAGAITDITTNTLSPTRTGTSVNLELPQALTATSDPTFNTIDVADAAGTRANLGLGEMAVADRIAAIADLSLTVSNPPTQAEVQAIANKMDALLGAMRTAAHLVP